MEPLQFNSDTIGTCVLVGKVSAFQGLKCAAS